MISFPWACSHSLEQAGTRGGCVIDAAIRSALLRFRPQRDHGALQRHPHANRSAKCFNTLTSAFQAEAARRQGEKRVVQWLCGDDAKAKEIVAGLVEDAGFVPVDLGGTAECSVMEAPRREGAVYGEAGSPSDARAVRRRCSRPAHDPAIPRYRSAAA